MRIQAPVVRSIQRVAECVRTDALDTLPRSAHSGSGLCWLAIGLEPETYENPQIWEILKKDERKEEKNEGEKKKEEVSEGPVETAPAAVLAVTSSDGKAVEKPEAAEKQEKTAAQPAAQPEAETPSKKARRRLPKVADYLGQVPGQLPSSGAAAPVDPRDF